MARLFQMSNLGGSDRANHWTRVFRTVLLGFLTVATGLGATGPAKSKIRTKVPAARIKISGYGMLGDRELKRILNTVELAGTRPEFLRAEFVEDAVVILGARMISDGFLHPRIAVEIELDGGGKMRVTNQDLLEKPLPRPLKIRKVHFHIKKGRLYYIDHLDFSGLKAVPEKTARSYFIETGVLVELKRSRIYTAERMRRGLNSLSDSLDRLGYQDAKVTLTGLKIDDQTGKVRGKVMVSEGLRWKVRAARVEYFYEGDTNVFRQTTNYPGKPYSRLWAQDFTQALKTNQFVRGFPDTSVTMKIERRDFQPGQVILDVAAQVYAGKKYRVESVEFRGQKRTRRSLLARRVRVQRGDLLNPLKMEEGRYRLAQLGPFSTVETAMEPATDESRKVIYTVKEGKAIDVSLLFGYGSYELLRAGVETEAYNLWGLAHHARLKLVQSFKASTADFTYTVPEYLGRDVDLFVNGNGLRREEISFTRLEYGGGFGAHRYFKPTSTDVTVRYNYQILNASEVPGVSITESPTNVAVGSIIFDLKHDRRDNPLYPRTGYKIFANLEFASEYLAGDVNYERVQLAASYHLPLGGGRYLGLGVSHGFALTVGGASRDLPFNRRFFPGGENSLRGYTEGEASPRNAAGRIIGAESYALGTAEFEQSITRQFSFVLFSDNLGFAEHAANYPFDTALFSVGGGLRWKTLIGPIRLEYGYNLNPRPRDPIGTIHFSLGFPF